MIGEFEGKELFANDPILLSSREIQIEKRARVKAGDPLVKKCGLKPDSLLENVPGFDVHHGFLLPWVGICRF